MLLNCEESTQRPDITLIGLFHENIPERHTHPEMWQALFSLTGYSDNRTYYGVRPARGGYWTCIKPISTLENILGKLQEYNCPAGNFAATHIADYTLDRGVLTRWPQTAAMKPDTDMSRDMVEELRGKSIILLRPTK